MPFVTSKDGTRIAYDRTGAGPVIVIVDGALCYRSFGPATQLAPLLADRFTVVTYDRRGRGDSSDTQPYSVEREIDDIDALISANGGRASLFGISSGAALSLAAAARLRSVERIALYEAPFMVSPNPERNADDYWRRISGAVHRNERGKALSLFFQLVGVPTPVIWLMHVMPMFRKLKGVAHTLPYDGAIVSENQRGRPLKASAWRTITAPALVMDGGKSPLWMRTGMRAVADALPNATYRTLPGQTHMVNARVQAPILSEFFSAPSHLPEPVT